MFSRTEREDQGLDLRFREPSWILLRSPEGIDPLSLLPVKSLKGTKCYWYEPTRCLGIVRIRQVSDLQNCQWRQLWKGVRNRACQVVVWQISARSGTRDVKWIASEIHYESRIDQALHTYMYWTALRFAKEDDDISPFRPLKDRFLQKDKLPLA